MNAALFSLFGGQADTKLYVEDVFSTYLYTGNGSTQTINNGIDLAGEGGLVWLKERSTADNHILTDTVRGVNKKLFTDSTIAQDSATSVTAFNADGFDIGTGGDINASGSTYASWTFRRAPKFFDVVTYTGNGVAGRQIPHELGITPGMVIVKSTTFASYWYLQHRSLGAAYYMYLNGTNAATTATSAWNNAAPTNEVFTVGDNNNVNQSGQNYVAYLFAHDDSEDGIIQCGSYVDQQVLNLGWEPQFVLIKKVDNTGNWVMFDTMRGIPVGVPTNYPFRIQANDSSAETAYGVQFDLTATGFKITGLGAGSFIYLAIRRPNKPPKSGTEVYNAIARTGTGTTATVTGVGFPVDLLIGINRNRAASNVNSFWDRMRGGGKYLDSATTSCEASNTSVSGFDLQDGVTMQGAVITNGNSYPYINHFFRRAPNFHDIVCYTGTGVARTVAHNLGVPPELMIVKARSNGAQQWNVYHFSLSSSGIAYLSSTALAQLVGRTEWNNTDPDISTFSLGTGDAINGASTTYVAYLFATCPGVSKVGSYVGNGTTQNIDCGFAAGARFVLIKRTDAAGDWYVWATALGIVAANDPHLSLNTTAAEVTTDDSVDPYAPGFAVNQVAATNINVNGASYIFLSIS